MPRTMYVPAPRVEQSDIGGLIPGMGEREHLIVVSNRGPLEYGFTRDGVPQARQGAGGVVSALLCAVRHHPVTWIALAMSDADRAVARAGHDMDSPMVSDPDLPRMDVRLVDIPPETYSRHYLGISNRILWFTQHYLLEPATSNAFSRRVSADWQRGYVAANRAVATAVLETLRTRGEHTPVLFQDYHLYLAPEMVRAACPTARLAHFVHIPWPEARYWDMLPHYIARSIYAGLAANDVIGFQTARDVQNFLLGAEHYLSGTQLKWQPSACAGELVCGRRRTTVRSFPIAVTREEVERCAQSPAARREAAEVRRQISQGTRDRQLIVRVDRLEPTKNIVRGFQAYEQLLRAHPEWQSKVTFLALLVPSRQGLTAYQRYEREVRRAIERINTRFGRADWQPIVAIFENNRPCALALMRNYSVLLVNPIIDGMNLVVKEGGLLNESDGVVVLSRTAGAFEQLGQHVLGIHPLDVEQTAEALHVALEMPTAERTARAHALRTQLRSESAASWLEAQVTSLAEATMPDMIAAKRTERCAVAADAPMASRGHALARPIAHPFAVLAPDEWATDRPAPFSVAEEGAEALPW